MTNQEINTQIQIIKKNFDEITMSICSFIDFGLYLDTPKHKSISDALDDNFAHNFVMYFYNNCQKDVDYNEHNFKDLMDVMIKVVISNMFRIHRTYYVNKDQETIVEPNNLRKIISMFTAQTEYNIKNPI